MNTVRHRATSSHRQLLPTHPFRRTGRSARRGIVAAVLAAVLSVSACATGPGDSEAAAGGGEETAVTVPSAYGDVTLERKPTRVLALTAQHAEMVVSLGEKPVAYSLGGLAGADVQKTHPWLADHDLGELDPTMVNAEYQPVLEAIAKHKPDLILGSTFQVSDKLYKQISEIAPTYVGEKLGSNSWESLLTGVGTLLGKEEAAKAEKQKVDDAYAEARRAMPGLEGKTYQSVGFDGTRFWFGNGSWLDGLGLVPAANQDNTQSNNGTGDISLENVAQLDADVLSIWYYKVDSSVLTGDPRYAKLPSVRNKAVLAPDLAHANATNSAGPLSLRWALDWMRGELAASAIAG